MNYNCIKFLIQFILPVIGLSVTNAVAAESVRIRAMIWDDGGSVADLYETGDNVPPPRGHTLYLWLGGAESIPLLIPFSDLSSTVSVSGTEGEIVFFKQPIDPTRPEAMPREAARVQLNGVRDALILLIPENLARNDYRAAVIDNSNHALPSNTLRVINLTRENLGVLFDQDRQIIPAGSQKLFPITSGIGSTSFLVVGYNIEGERRMRYQSQRIPVFQNARVTSLIASPPTGGRLLMTAIIDDPVDNYDDEE